MWDQYNGFWYHTAKAILRIYKFICINSIQIEGVDNLLPGQPKIVVANHPNATDGFMLPFIFPDKLHFLILEENFTIPVFGRLLAFADQIPVVLGRGYEALETAKEKLLNGNTVVIFPEGYLTHGKKFRRAGAGAAILACETRKPVIPIGIYVPSGFTHTFRARFFDRNTAGRWQIRGHCYVHIGSPIFTSKITELENSYRALRQFSNKIMAEIIRLANQAREKAQK